MQASSSKQAKRQRETPDPEAETLKVPSPQWLGPGCPMQAVLFVVHIFGDVRDMWDM